MERKDTHGHHAQRQARANDSHRRPRTVEVYIAALSETCLAGTGDLAEVGAGYTFFWSGN